MKSILKLLLLVSLMVVSRLDKQNWHLTAKANKESIPATYPVSDNNFTKVVNSPIQQFYISQK
ncbi:hypothetical protein [Adhaeribacter radiodurans]|uniref:Uncharacterized protein n=1 Tax=Adhaeribacter radiodurans TaxID=2745197 RepID=A0A7L7L384_9BACT|nr:hypothetical protein [Adhaeribacter radiodurans]QMU27025.1 hypothetical protein HUW48_02800 [Adhaeribacter radiodurans]